MAYAQQPNVQITREDGWKLVCEGGPNVLIQSIGSAGVVLTISAAAPAANSGSGFHLASPANPFAMSGLTTEKIYARALGYSAELAVAKG